MVLSATAVQPVVNYARFTKINQDPATAEAWLQSLPQPIRDQFLARISKIYRSMPPVIQLEVQRDIIAKGGIPMVTPTVEGLGAGDFGWTQASQLLVSLSNVGASLFNAYRSGTQAKDIAAGAQATSAQIAEAQAEAEKAVQVAMIGAQKEAAVAKAGIIAQSQSMWAASMPYILGGAGVLGLIFVILKSRSKKTP